MVDLEMCDPFLSFQLDSYETDQLLHTSGGSGGTAIIATAGGSFLVQWSLLLSRTRVVFALGQSSQKGLMRSISSGDIPELSLTVELEAASCTASLKNWQ